MGSLEDNHDGTENVKSKMWETATEVTEPETILIQGHLPSWLTGNYLRIGPGKFDFKSGFSMTHWLDGYALISRFQIQTKDEDHQTVSFQSAYLQSNAYIQAMKNNGPQISEFATPGTNVEQNSRKGFLSRMLPNIVPQTTDNTNHGWCFFRNLGHSKCDLESSLQPLFLFATNDAGFLNQVDLGELKFVGQVTPNSLGLHMCTPHPLTDNETSVTYNLGTSTTITGLKYNFIQIPPPRVVNSQVELSGSRVLCSVPSQWTSHLSFNHSFGMTSHFLIFIEQPLVINIAKLLSGSIRGRKEAFRDWLEWKPSNINQFYIIDKLTGQIINHKILIQSSSPFLFLHIINCYEDITQNDLVIDLSSYEDAQVLLGPSQVLSHVRRKIWKCGDTSQNSPKLHRYRIPLDAIGINIQNGSIRASQSSGSKLAIFILNPTEIIQEGGLELASINLKFFGNSYKYFYASGLMSQGRFKNSIVKVDVTLRSVTAIFRLSDFGIFGEPVFVPDPNGTKEESGILIVPLTDIRLTHPDMLIFLSAIDMVEIARAVFHRVWIPAAIHGIFITDS